MSTPVPKCLLRKRNLCGIGRLGKRRAMMGKEQAEIQSIQVWQRLFNVLTKGAQHEYKEECEYMPGHVVCALLPGGAACWFVGRILPSQYLGMEEFDGKNAE